MKLLSERFRRWVGRRMHLSASPIIRAEFPRDPRSPVVLMRNAMHPMNVELWSTSGKIQTVGPIAGAIPDFVSCPETETGAIKQFTLMQYDYRTLVYAEQIDQPPTQVEEKA